MLVPKRQKYRKQFRGSWRTIAIKGDKLNFGKFGLKAIESGWIKDKQIEAARVILARATRKIGKYWIRIFPDKPYTQKPQGVTMGAGKGEVIGYVAVVSPGKILFEIDGLDDQEAKKTLKNIGCKLSIKTKIIKREL
jgi:large subunit ribosomal protein L16